jgi:glucose-1-phosphate thymidylyltransferase
MKALVLCGGRGTRLRPLTHTQAKAALPVAGCPVLSHILSYLHHNGFDEVGVVISPDQGELKTIHVPADGQQVRFITQRSARGIAHAVRCAESYLGDQPFLLYLGDNLTSEELRPLVQRFVQEQPQGLIAVRHVPNPQAFGIAEVAADRIVRVVEKPRVPAGNLAIAGIYIFGPAIHSQIHELKPSARGEYEITDAITGLLESGGTVLAHRMQGWWQDMGSPDGMLSANSLLLDGITPSIAPDVSLESTRIQGRVRIGPGVMLDNVRLRGPLVIGPNCRLRNAYVGPYTSIGENSEITDASVENSILLPECHLYSPVLHLEDCLLGRGCVIEGKSGRSFTLIVGDDGHLRLPMDGRWS